MKTIHVYVMRHGNYDRKTGKLTDAGRGRVAAAARAHLSGKQFGDVFHSGMDRTLETVYGALEAIGHEMPINSPMADGMFGYQWVENDDPGYYERVRTALAAGQPNTSALWHEHWKCAAQVSQVVREQILRNARIRAETPGDAHDIFIGSHEFIGVSATLDPNTPCLGEADIIRYDVEVDELSVKVVGWEIFPAPPVL